MKVKIIAAAVLAIVIFAGYTTVHAPGGDKAAKSSFDKKQYSLTNPESIWLIVNKQHPLQPIDYAPHLSVPDIPLRLPSDDGEMHVAAIMAPALKQLVAAAKKDGLSLMLASGYRSYTLQTTVYNAEVSDYGKVRADAESARPGYSEHQTGLAADLEPTSRQCEVEKCFASLPEGKWLAANAYKYGFILRYPKDKVAITGYEYEPWHVRYVGTALSEEMHSESIATLEEFFGQPAAPSY